MSKNYALKAAGRTGTGKGVARALRRDNQIPAVIYGDNKEPVLITLGMNDTNVEYNRGHMMSTVCEMDVDGDKHLVLARDVQLHPVSDRVEHVDFLRVTKKTRIAVNIPVNLINEDLSPGLKDGGILDVARYEVELYCSALEIPDQIDVDLTGLEQGDAARISNAALPEGVTPVIDDRDFVIANIATPRTAEEEEAAEEEADAEIEASEASEEGDAEGGSDEKAEAAEE